jgi:ComF family protein
VARGSALTARACLGLYTGPLREAVLLLKYQDRRGIARELGSLLAFRLEEWREEWRPDGLVPVPIHSQRRRERGYNQAELLAETVGELCGLPVRLALERVVDTLPQVQFGRDRQARQKNVCDSIRPGGDASPGRRPVLIDDVQTTGATLEESARALREAGAHEVFALTLCGSPSPVHTRQRAATRR